MPILGLKDDQLRASLYLRELNRSNNKLAHFDDLVARISGVDAEGLLQLKSEFTLAYVQTNFSSFDEAGYVWSSFADATIDRAIDLAWEKTAKRRRLKLPDGKVPGLFLLGLGKLGGRDLNFSSDVDLIAFYDPETLPVPEHMGQAFIASEVCKTVTQILQPRNAPGFVWRVDWRLRPESSGTGLAMSTNKAETFYFFRSLPWHRLALMKARPIAGDHGAGETFLSRLEPFIWRRNLDFTTLDELAALKTRINNEHPGLQYERAAPDPITPEAPGFNLKLGRGGIREIEFIANAQQLIHGGKRPALRTTHTRTALLELADAELLSREDANELRDHYQIFRQIENAVQMLENTQTHIIPDGDKLASLLDLLGHPSELDTDLFARRQFVHEKFSTLFSERSNTEKSNDLSSLNPEEMQIAASWENGFRDHGLSLSQQRKYGDLGRRLTARLLTQPSEDNAFQRVDNFLKQIGRSGPYFALLNQRDDLQDKLIAPLLYSPHMSRILRQSPHIIDIFLATNPGSLIEQSQFVLTSPDYEHRLESLRRFVNEQLFLDYTDFLEGTKTALDTQTQLTSLAEQTLNLAIQLVADDIGLTNIPMTVLGLGKMGTSTMMPQSDLDLIFIFADETETELASKIVQRLRTTLTVKLREGIAYELDMRLRPSGRSGPPAVKLSSFREHHMKRAHSWEHIALAPARIVAGDIALGEKVMKIKEEIFARPRDQAAFKQDAMTMYARLSEERLQDTPLDVWRTKLRANGLMTADYIRSCWAVLGAAPDQNLVDAIDDWNRLLTWERLLGMTKRPLSETPDAFAGAIDLPSLPSQHAQLEKSVKQSFDALFKNTGEPLSLDPRPIIWKN